MNIRFTSGLTLSTASLALVVAAACGEDRGSFTTAPTVFEPAPEEPIDAGADASVLGVETAPLDDTSP